MHYLVVEKEVLEKFYDPENDKSVLNQRFIIIAEDKIRWHGGTVSLGYNDGYITFAKAKMKELGVIRGDKVSFTLEKDTSEFGFEVPEEFLELLRQDEEGNRRFRSLTMGKQRSIIYLVLQLKSSQKRINKSIFLLENLKRAPVGKETMRHALGKDLPD